MLQIVFVAIICAVITVYLKNINVELSILSSIMSGIILLNLVLIEFGEVFDFFDKIISLTGIDEGLYKIIFKIIAIGYLIEFSASLVEDFGMKSLSTKLIFAGKIIILTTSLPIIYSILSIFIQLF